MKVQNKFEKRLEVIPSSILLLIAQIDELKGRWSAGTNLHPQILGRLKRSVLITSTGASTRIEGAKLSDEDVEKFMLGIDVQRFTDRDSQEVRGYYELLQNVFNAWESIRLSEGLIKHFHKELLKYVKKDIFHSGQYKQTENKVRMINTKGEVIGTIFNTTPVHLTPIKMQELTEWTIDVWQKKQYHPLLIIGNFIVEFLIIHPFSDGNGRLSRILTNLLLLQSGYLYIPYISHEKFIEDNKLDYYLALRKSQKTFNIDNEDITTWLGFFLKILLKQSEEAVVLLSSEQTEKILSEKQLSIWKHIQKVREITPRELIKKTGIVRPTLNQALDKLIKLKKIQRIGMGRSTRYRDY